MGKQQNARAKRVDNNEWVYGYYVYIEETDKHYIFTGIMFNDTYECYEVKSNTVCPFVGSINGAQKVFGGDILKDQENGKEYLITYNGEGSFVGNETYVRVSDINGAEVVLKECVKLSDIKKPIVVGNIYDKAIGE